MFVIKTDRLATLLPWLVVTRKTGVCSAFAWLYWTNHLMIRIVRIVMITENPNNEDQFMDHLGNKGGKE